MRSDFKDTVDMPGRLTHTHTVEHLWWTTVNTASYDLEKKKKHQTKIYVQDFKSRILDFIKQKKRTA